MYVLFLNWWLLDLPLPHTASTIMYVSTLTTGYLGLLMAGLWMSRLYKNNLMTDVFNNENESFGQETQLMEMSILSICRPDSNTVEGSMTDGSTW